MSQTAEGKYLVDSYLDWCQAEGVPIIDDFGIDMLTIEPGRWERYGMNGAFCHLHGRDDFVSIFLFEIPPGGGSAELSHIYEEVIYVLAGHGSTQVTTEDGHKHTFEWGPKSLFSLPLNARYRHFNGSGREPARFASVNNLVYVMNRFRNLDFIFDNPWRFPEREGAADYFAGEGEFIPLRPGRHQWETNFVPDISNFELKAWEARGARSTNLRFMLAENSIGCHTSEMPVGTYKKGHRHMNGVNVFAVTGKGYSLLWYEGDEEFERIDWHHGVVYSPPDQMFHQHFNIAQVPSRYLAVQMGTTRYPLTQAKRAVWDKAVDKDIKQGGIQIEYGDQDPRIHNIWLKEIDKMGVASGMGDFIDEAPHQPAAAPE